MASVREDDDNFTDRDDGEAYCEDRGSDAEDQYPDEEYEDDLEAYLADVNIDDLSTKRSEAPASSMESRSEIFSERRTPLLGFRSDSRRSRVKFRARRC